MPDPSWKHWCLKKVIVLKIPSVIQIPHLPRLACSALCSNGIYYKDESDGLVHSSHNISTINAALCADAQLANHFGLLTCTNGAAPSANGGILGGSWSTSCAPLVHTGPVGALSSNMLAATCGLNYGQPSWINMAMCAPSATMTNVNGVLVCSSLANAVPGEWGMSSDGCLSWWGVNAQRGYWALDFIVMGGPYHPLPPCLTGGPWSTTCSPISYIGSVLSAYCGLFFPNGTARVSKIDTSVCTADSANQITNQYGALSCIGAAAPGLPGGSWLQSCTPNTWSGAWLTATCGLPNALISTLNYALCAPGATVADMDGRLVCSDLNADLTGEQAGRV